LLQLKFHFLKFLGCQFLSSFHSTNIHAPHNPLATYLIKVAELRREAAPPLGEAISNPPKASCLLCVGGRTLDIWDSLLREQSSRSLTPGIVSPFSFALQLFSHSHSTSRCMKPSARYPALLCRPNLHRQRSSVLRLHSWLLTTIS
jgi:hypothetical protein